MDRLVRRSRLRRQDAAVRSGYLHCRVELKGDSCSTDKPAHRWRLLGEISAAALVQKS